MSAARSPEEGAKRPEPATDPEAGPAAPSPGTLLRGIAVSPGLVLGPVHRKGHDLDSVRLERAPLDEVDGELNRFHQALEDSKAQLRALREELQGRVREEDVRILDTHLTYLRDSVFLADVENLILGEQMRLEAAVAKVVGDFDRIFRLVQSETLRQSAVDLRDVGIRVLRNLERRGGEADDDERTPESYVLVARELSIVDMFDLRNRRVLGIATEEGAPAGHAAIFARSMRIPTITGVGGLLDAAREGDFAILDAAEGVLRLNPDEVVRRQYATAAVEGHPEEDEADDADGRVTTRDGRTIEVAAACGNVPEVEHAARRGAASIGLYRTELLYLLDRRPPSRDALAQHYAAVLDAARGRTVTFRLLNADASLGLAYLHPEPEANPSLGRAGVRALLANEGVLRRQLQALLLASPAAALRVAVPFVTDVDELRAVRSLLLDERVALEREGELARKRVPLGAVVETPAALLGLEELATEADFLLVGLDALVQYLLAADRENPALASRFETPHPVVLRALAQAARIAEEAGRELSVFGETAGDPAVLPLLVGAGARRLVVPPGALRAAREAAQELDTAEAGRAAAAAGADVRGFRHGWAGG